MLSDALAARDRLKAAPADFFICEAELSGNETASLFGAIRHSDLGSDPFLPTITTIWEPTAHLINGIVNAGADHILTLPMARGKVRKVIGAIVETRKPFIATSEYIGPNRCNDERGKADGIPRIAVPNSLRYKATGDDDGLDHYEVLQNVQEVRIKRYVNKVVITADMIADDAAAAPEGGGDLRLHLDEFCGATNDLSHRITGTRFRHQSELCRSLVTVAEGLQDSPEPRNNDLELLQQLALAVQVAVSSADE